MIGAIGAAALCAYLTGWLAPLQTVLADYRFHAYDRAASGKLLLVDIDAQSLSTIGVWPWPRRIHAVITDRLVGAGAATIAFDVDFSAGSDDRNDQIFAESLERAGGGVLLAVFKQAANSRDHESEVSFNQPIAPLAARSWPAHVNVVSDGVGTVREIVLSKKFGGQIVPAMAAMLAEFSGDISKTAVIDFSIDPRSIARISANDLLAGRVDSSLIAGRSVLVGAAALELRDVFHVPRYGIISGPLVQALAAETLIQDRAIRSAGAVPTILGVLLLVVLFSFIPTRTDWRAVIIGLGVTVVAVEAAATVFQVVTAVSLETAVWHATLFCFAALVIVREIIHRRVLLDGSRGEVQSTRVLLDRVVADNFAGIFVFDENGTVRAMSRRASEILGCPDITGHHLSEMNSPELSRIALNAFSAARENAFEWGRGDLSLEMGGMARRLEYNLTISRLKSEDETLVGCLTFRDVTEERAAQDRLIYLASNDVLTGLGNRNAFSEELEYALQNVQSVSVLFFDLDRFKTINDTLGHSVGDDLLRAVAERVKIIAGPKRFVSRFGGDEYALFLRDVDAHDTLAFGQVLISAISDPFTVQGHKIVVGASVGCSIGSGNDDPVQLIKNADTALYRAKAAGGGNALLFDPDMDKALQKRRALELDLRRALEEWQFELAFQPQVDLASRQITGAEVLLRWPHPDLGYVSPADFIPIAESNGIVNEIGGRVLVEACKIAASWNNAIKLSVNVSPVQFARGNLVQQVEEALAISGLPSDRLDLEITESLFILDRANIKLTMEKLRDIGVSFSIDDFGTGYSSLSYIREFPVDKIKIDKTFVAGLPIHQDAVAIVSAVVAMANSLGLKVNAEGVETETQADALRLLGCHEGQGWLFGKPQPAPDFSLKIDSCDSQAA